MNLIRPEFAKFSSEQVPGTVCKLYPAMRDVIIIPLYSFAPYTFQFITRVRLDFFSLYSYFLLSSTFYEFAVYFEWGF